MPSITNVTDSPGVPITCDYVRGRIGELQQRIETWQVAGMNGYGAQQLGLGDSQFAIVVVRYGSEANVDVWLSQIAALQGKRATVVDDWDATHANLLINRVQVQPKVAEAGNGGCRGEARIEGVVVP